MIKAAHQIQQGQTVLGKAQEAVSNTAHSISDTLSGSKK
jgi:hypothetical protein